MNKPKINVANTSDLTPDEWRELRLTGCVIKGDRIIRTLSHIKRVEAGARKEIGRIARRVFA
jgi:hypothetical protein